MITIEQEDIHSPNAKTLIQELNEILKTITGASGKNSFHSEDMQNERSLFLVAYMDHTPMGCGALRPIQEDTAELKRIYARPNHCGIGSVILRSLEDHARLLGYKKVVLETRKVNEKATHFYLINGYQICPHYGKYIGHTEAVCFIKALLP